MVLLVVAGFMYWVLATTPGARWALVTGVAQVGGSVSGVSGSVWKGLDIGRLTLPPEHVGVDVSDLHLRVDWSKLLDRELLVQDLSMGRLAVALTTEEESATEPEPFLMPDLPVRVQIDRLALGEFSLSHNGIPLPVSLGNLTTSLSLDDGQGKLGLSTLDVGNDKVNAQLKGDFRLLGWGEPWPFDAAFSMHVLGRDSDSVLCAQEYLPSLPQQSGSMLDCAVDVTIDAKGDLKDVVLNIEAQGQDMALTARANLTPLAAFPLKDARVDLTLADQSSLHAQVDWLAQDGSQTGAIDGVDQDHITGTLQTTKLDLGQLVGSPLPAAILTSSGRFDIHIKNRSELVSANIDFDFAEGSMWNSEPLQGVLKARVDTDPDHVATAVAEPAGIAALEWRALRFQDVDIDVRLGKNQVQAKGGFGLPERDLALDVKAPVLSSFWPGIPGGVALKAQAVGALKQHTLTLDGTYTPDSSVPDKLGEAPVQLALDIRGGWLQNAPTDPAENESTTSASNEGWVGQIRSLEAHHASLGLVLSKAPSFSFMPGSVTSDGLWKLGRADIDLTLDRRPVLHLAHMASSGGAAGQWATEGKIEKLVISQTLIDDIQKVVSLTQEGTAASATPKRGGVKIRGAKSANTEIALALDWDLRFDKALAGTLKGRYLSGDLMVPADPPFPLGLQALSLNVTAKPAGDTVSQINADLSVVTADMGKASATVATRLHATPGGGLALDPKDATTVTVKADIDDLGWVSLFAGDAMDFGGKVNADVTLVSQSDGGWDSKGTVTGTDLRIVRIDEGIRLLDGTLSARLQGDRVILDKLYFPARLRVEPKEWRTAEWVTTNPEARDGYLQLSGDWRLSDMAGDVDVKLHRYPVMQRSDRYAMVSGALHIVAALPAMSITGSVTADAGWVGLDMMAGIPTLDSDVVIIRAGDEAKERPVPMDISMDIQVDLGPRFYLTGYGVNSGLVGSLRIMMIADKLTAVGALRTRGGAIEAYGQRLQLRRGTITFQGDIASPVLNIEALRTGLPIEAGVRVSGTGKRPKIDLVSYPDVSEIEKLSWLLFGHGPDESGGDMALLLSVGTSFLGDGEPFYRKFGIDELSLQSGALGSAGSILPAESVVSGLNSGASDLERKFISASKGITNDLTISVRQALSDTGTVGLLSYQLARGLTAELSVGSINGLALVYRWFSRD